MPANVTPPCNCSQPLLPPWYFSISPAAHGNGYLPNVTIPASQAAALTESPDATGAISGTLETIQPVVGSPSTSMPVSQATGQFPRLDNTGANLRTLETTLPTKISTSVLQSVSQVTAEPEHPDTTSDVSSTLETFDLVDDAPIGAHQNIYKRSLKSPWRTDTLVRDVAIQCQIIRKRPDGKLETKKGGVPGATPSPKSKKGGVLTTTSSPEDQITIEGSQGGGPPEPFISPEQAQRSMPPGVSPRQFLPGRRPMMGHPTPAKAGHMGQRPVPSPRMTRNTAKMTNDSLKEGKPLTSAPDPPVRVSSRAAEGVNPLLYAAATSR